MQPQSLALSVLFFGSFRSKNKFSIILIFNPLAIKLLSNKTAPKNHSKISSISLTKQLENQLKCTMLIPLRHYDIASYISCLLQLVWICHKTCLLGWILHLQRVELRGYLQLEDCQVEDFPYIKINKKSSFVRYILKCVVFPLSACERQR